MVSQGSEAFAVIVAGGRQHRVTPGEVLRVDRLGSEAGAEVTFDKVLLWGSGSEVKVGSPTLPGAVVRARVLDERRDKKVLVFRYKKRKGFRKLRGHREYFTLVRIEAIEPGA
jgi:large subunit ribosomal protein L21